MSDDLVKRLRGGLAIGEEAADRIEELEGQLQSVLDRETSILRYYDAKLDAADAKLAKVEDRLFNCAMDLNIYMDLVEKLQEELDNRERSNELRKETTDAGR